MFRPKAARIFSARSFGPRAVRRSKDGGASGISAAAEPGAGAVASLVAFAGGGAAAGEGTVGSTWAGAAGTTIGVVATGVTASDLDECESRAPHETRNAAINRTGAGDRLFIFNVVSSKA